MSIARLGQPKDGSPIHIRNYKFEAYCNPKKGNVFLTDEWEGVTCYKCIIKGCVAGEFVFHTQDDYPTRSAYIDYLYKYCRKDLTRAGLVHRISKGMSPIEAISVKPERMPPRDHPYKAKSFVKETTRKVMKCRNR